MKAARPSAAERLMRSSPTVQPSVGRSVRGDARVRPIRFTIDLTPDAHDAFSDWAYKNRLSKADVVRTLLGLLDSDADVAAKVHRSLAVQ